MTQAMLATTVADTQLKQQQFRQYLKFAGWPNAFFVVVLLGATVFYQSVIPLVWAIATFINGSLYWLADRRVQAGSLEKAAPLICYGTWGIVLLCMFTEGRGLSLHILLAFAPVISVMHYISIKSLGRLLAHVGLLISFDAVLFAMNVLPTASPALSELDVAIFANWGSAIIAGTGVVSLTHNVRLRRRYREQLEQANLALKSSHETLEKRVIARRIELTRSQGELARARDIALAASQHKAIFVANTSHELRTPLNAIIGFSEMLQQQVFGPLQDRQLEYVDDIHVSATRLLRLINNILDQARLNSGSFPLNLTSVNLAATVEAVVEANQRKLLANRLQLDLNIDKDFEVHADSALLHKIIDNLLDNAIRYAPANSSLGMNASLDSSDVHLSVSDQGPGFSESQISRVFEAFSTGTDRREQAGAGLGLALSQQLARLQDGDLSVANGDTGGAVITLRIPRSAGNREERFA